jgi:hypothetical protein
MAATRANGGGHAKLCLSMKLFRVAAFILVGCAPVGRSASDVPVYVSVHGGSDMHVLLASGVRTPCDAGDNVVLFEGTMHPGTTRVLMASFPTLCERHTWGELRDRRWSSDTLWKAIRGSARIDIDLSADHP